MLQLGILIHFEGRDSNFDQGQNLSLLRAASYTLQAVTALVTRSTAWWVQAVIHGKSLVSAMSVCAIIGLRLNRSGIVASTEFGYKKSL